VIMVAKIKSKAAGGQKKLSRSFRHGRAGTGSVHTHSQKFFGKKVCSPHDVPKGGIKNSPAWKLVLKRSEGKKPDPPEKRLGAPIKGGYPPNKWPVNVLVDPERAFWLPDDWGQGIKNTGTGGTYLGWVSPAGKFFYHKNLGGYWEQGVDVEVGRTLTPLDGFNGILRKVEQRCPTGSDKKFLAAVLTAAERRLVPPADAFHFCIVSARRAGHEGQIDVMLVEAHFRHVGVRPTWYVDEGSLEAYRALGLKAIVGGKLTPARNLALEHARKQNKVCVQVSDDISLWEYFNIPQLHNLGSDFKKMNAAVTKAEQSGQVFPISPIGAAQFLIAKMRSHSSRPQLGGVFPQANMAMGVGVPEVGYEHFVLGDFFVAEPTSPCRFDATMTLKEDYDYTCSHLAKHGLVLRSNRMILRVKHQSNAGGAVSARDSAGAKERENIAILQRKWPGVFSLNGRRQNEVVMCWSRLNGQSEPKAAKTTAAKTTAAKTTAAKTTPMKVRAVASQASSAAAARLPANLPAEATVQWTEATSKVPYITKRCQRADGCTVEELIRKFTYSNNGIKKRYTLQDLRYDLAGGRLKLSSSKGAITKGRHAKK